MRSTMLPGYPDLRIVCRYHLGQKPQKIALPIIQRNGFSASPRRQLKDLNTEPKEKSGRAGRAGRGRSPTGLPFGSLTFK